jgi:branched-chain amino acid transport system permease protein
MGIELTWDVLAQAIMLGLMNGAFYALLSLGLSITFGILDVVNFAHGAMYMMGAFVAWMLMAYLGIGFWTSLIVAPLAIGMFGILIERTMVSRLYGLHHIYGLLLTFGMTHVIEGIFRIGFSVSGQRYPVPEALRGGVDLGFIFMPLYRLWVIGASLFICVGIWLAINKTRLGSYLRASIENASLVRAFGINVPRMVTLTFGLGAGLAGLTGVLAAPIFSVSPLMGSNIVVVVFAVVVIGGLGSIMGSIVGGFALGIVESLTQIFYSQASHVGIFIAMMLVLLVKQGGLSGATARMT